MGGRGGEQGAEICGDEGERENVCLINKQQLSRSASGDCYNISRIIAQAIHLIFPPLLKDKAQLNIALKINKH